MGAVFGGGIDVGEELAAIACRRRGLVRQVLRKASAPQGSLGSGGPEGDRRGARDADARFAVEGDSDADDVRMLDLRMRRHGADPELTALTPDPAQLRNAAEVDEESRLGEAELHQGDEAVPAGEELGVLAATSQRVEGVPK